jgi:uncharacterized membrane protein
MWNVAVRYGVTLVVFFGADAAWLSYIGPALFRPTLGPILRDSVNWPAALLFYLLYAVGLVYFSVGPALDGQSWKLALVNGVLFGFFAYATYDLTNLATLGAWTYRLAAVDIVWGSLLSAGSGVAGYFLSRAFGAH